MQPEKIIYRAHAVATGGRSGEAFTSDGLLDVKLAPPKEMGGTGTATNPEQLFAVGYAACFLGAVKSVANKRNLALPENVTVHSSVGVGPIPGGYGIEVDLKLSAPGVRKCDLEDIMQAAHHVCPYSNATRNNISVRLSVMECEKSPTDNR